MNNDLSSVISEGSIKSRYPEVHLLPSANALVDYFKFKFKKLVLRFHVFKLSPSNTTAYDRLGTVAELIEHWSRVR